MSDARQASDGGQKPSADAKSDTQSATPPPSALASADGGTVTKIAYGVMFGLVIGVLIGLGSFTLAPAPNAEPPAQQAARP